MDCGACRSVKLLEHAMTIAERVLVPIDDMHFGFMPGKGTTHELFILRRMQQEFCGREKKLYECFVDLQKAFDRVPRIALYCIVFLFGVNHNKYDSQK